MERKHLLGDTEKLSTEKTKGPCHHGPVLQCQILVAVCLAKSGLRVNFLAVICRGAASTSSSRLEHENHYFNPSLLTLIGWINVFVLCLIWMNSSKWPWKQVNIHLSSPPDNRRQREVALPSLSLQPSIRKSSALCRAHIYQMITEMTETGNTYWGRLFILSRFTLATQEAVMSNFIL